MQRAVFRQRRGIGRRLSTQMSEMFVYDKQYINGEWIQSENEEKSTIPVHDSNSGKIFAEVVDGCSKDTEKAIAAAKSAFQEWSTVDLKTRKMYLHRILKEYNKRVEHVSEALQKELGAPKYLADTFQSTSFAMHIEAVLKIADKFSWTEKIGDRSIVVREPIGVCGLITPWNWPLNQIGAKLAPALLAGCTVVLKPSEITPINAYIVAEAIHASDLPRGVFNMVCGTGPRVGQLLATHPDVDMLSFTGSTAVGRSLHALGSSTVKRVRTELGGKSACILLDDATRKQIVAMSTNVIGNTGQSCNALSRLLVPRKRYDEIIEIVKAAFESVNIVSATDPSAKPGSMGPLASRQQFEKVRRYIQTGIDEGATLVTGGVERPEDPTLQPGGYFVQPTVFGDVTNEMTIFKEEIFGPVLCVMPYDTVEEAIEIANDTIYGLNNAVAGKDIERAMKVARRLRSGQVQVNTTSGTPLTPFGGYKQSGDGREWGKYGLEEFLQIKAINVPKHSKL